MAREADVAIVGAGPAGARAAYLLALQGAHVCVYDASHPREKPCGGGVTGRALDLVHDAIDPRRFPQTAIRTARFGRAVVPLDPGALVVASRAAFDTALVDAALDVGAVVERARVTDVRVDAGLVTLETSAGVRRAGFVIGADGATSLVRRRVAAAFRRDQLSIATGFFAHGVTSDEIVIELIADPPGYIWSFPRPDHLAIGMCAQGDAGWTAGRLRAQVAQWIAEARIAPGARLASYSWPIPSLDGADLAALRVSGDRWALVGDAAGLVDPITREGIYFALASADWIAQALTARSDAHATYSRRVRDEAVPELARAARLKAGFFRPAFMALVTRALEESAAIRAVMADLIAGRQPYATLKWRLIKTFEARLAWRALVG